MGADSRAVVPDAYLGREQAFIKHKLLESYLEKLFLIIGMSSRKLGLSEICYVDCFAGPWSSESESLTDTSIGISLRMLDKCQKGLHARNIPLQFRALYVERDDDAFTRLDNFLSTHTPKGITSTAMHGDFVELRSKILDWCGNSAFVFFFIDPKGWKDVSISVLQPLLRRQKSEFLINFMYDFVNRTASMAEWQDEISVLLGEQVDLGGLVPNEREQLLLNTYRRNLKRELPRGGNWKSRSAYVRVLDRTKERPKYHLVYLTMHPRGVVEFMEISETVDLVQKQVRASARQAIRSAKTGMDELFGSDSFVNQQDGHVEASEVEKYWREYLLDGPRRVNEEEFANILEMTDWFPGDFQLALRGLIESGNVRNLDARGKRTKKPLHWNGPGETLELTGK